MDSIDEVLESTKRIRVVLAARGTPRDELCLAATLRAVTNGQSVLFFTATDLGQRHMRYDVFPPDYKDNGVTFHTLDWIDSHKFIHEAVAELGGFIEGSPDHSLIILSDPYIFGRWSQFYMRKVIGGVMKKHNSRLLIVSYPFHISGKRLAYSRLYRLCRQAELMPEMIDLWRWPSPIEYRSRFDYWYTPEMVQRELLARWKDDS